MICLICNEEMTYWYVIQNSVIFECPDCEFARMLEEKE